MPFRTSTLSYLSPLLDSRALFQFRIAMSINAKAEPIPHWSIQRFYFIYKRKLFHLDYHTHSPSLSSIINNVPLYRESFVTRLLKALLVKFTSLERVSGMTLWLRKGASFSKSILRTFLPDEFHLFQIPSVSMTSSTFISHGSRGENNYITGDVSQLLETYWYYYYFRDIRYFTDLLSPAGRKCFDYRDEFYLYLYYFHAVTNRQIHRCWRSS